MTLLSNSRSFLANPLPQGVGAVLKGSADHDAPAHPAHHAPTAHAYVYNLACANPSLAIPFTVQLGECSLISFMQPCAPRTQRLLDRGCD